MKFDLTQPCKTCPFRTDVNPFLNYDRALQIATIDGTFSCHNTNESDDEGDTFETENSQHCAGKLILMEKTEQPTQMMRIMERIGVYDRNKMKMDSPVFDDAYEMAEHHGMAY